MSRRILITPERVEDVAKQFKQGSEQSQELISVLTQAVQSMEGEWDGVTKQRFFQQFQEANQQMQLFVHMLNTIDSELSAIAQKFRTVDGQ
ncbi:WXG100 family type VII secretion target [Paenibacillus sp. 481]|uniref:WXG100 family type VII secretion target n=1 Tax=Paenibacillus sp. 481 TaxID=2835869 RepID=UPI001E2F2A5E|nr:WXG100 family type VII secretion target [Paenibacillus sp. 481]UHA73838.1 WXG100 family type VII secretion target [Paenibacillus sp. 481]